MMAPCAVHRLRRLVGDFFCDLKYTTGPQGQCLTDSKGREHASHLKPNRHALWLILDDGVVPGKHTDFVVKSKRRVLVLAWISKVWQNLLPTARVVIEERDVRYN